MSEDCTIRGGMLLDGDGGLRPGDLAISGGRIRRIAPKLPPGEVIWMRPA